MAKEPAIRSLTIQNLLSFGPEPTTVELRNLNVLIGPNGSGKSNLIEVLGLLRAAPYRDGLAIVIVTGGPISEWLWKGPRKSRLAPSAKIEAILSPGWGGVDLRYRLALAKGPGLRFSITDEALEDESPPPLAEEPEFYYRWENGRPKLNTKSPPTPQEIVSAQRVSQEFDPQASVLSQRKDPLHYPELTRVGEMFDSIRLYRNWEFGPSAALRQPSDAGDSGDYLSESLLNLGVVLTRLLSIPATKDKILASLRLFYEDITDLRPAIEGTRVQIRVQEKYLEVGIPLSRMSDGTLRWLALLAILLNPDTPTLVCIEEPELGLHPDMIHELAKLLIEASTRMQLIITTHSDRLVEEFTDAPEAVVVCEKENGASKFRRLDKDKLSSWLEDYTLGQIWTRGQIGGTRW